jgi:hypothetical protein
VRGARDLHRRRARRRPHRPRIRHPATLRPPISALQLAQTKNAQVTVDLRTNVSKLRSLACRYTTDEDTRELAVSPPVLRLPSSAPEFAHDFGLAAGAAC